MYKRSVSLLAFALFGALLPGCATSGAEEGVQRVEYSEHVTFLFRSNPSGNSVTFENEGPDPVELVLLLLKAEALEETSGGEVKVGEAPTMLVSKLRGFRLEHDQPGSAALTWSTQPDFESQVEVRVDE